MQVRFIVPLLLTGLVFPTLSFAEGTPKTKQIIHSVFKGTLLRGPKADGEKYWREAIEKNGIAGVVSLAGTIGASDEFQRVCKAHDSESLARNMFFHVYGRNPTVEEISDVTSSLEQHGSKAHFLKGFVDTYEFREKYFY